MNHTDKNIIKTGTQLALTNLYIIRLIRESKFYEIKNICKNIKGINLLFPVGSMQLIISKINISIKMEIYFIISIFIIDIFDKFDVFGFIKVFYILYFM